MALIRFATVCEICGYLIPSYIMNPCSANLVVIPHSLARDYQAEKDFQQQAHRYCSKRKADQPITPELVAECREVIQPLIERTPDAYWGTANNPQLLSFSKGQISDKRRGSRPSLPVTTELDAFESITLQQSWPSKISSKYR